MIIEIIVIILSFLITGYGIYRYGGNEVAGQEIVAQGDDVINENYENNENEEQQIEVQENGEQQIVVQGNEEERNENNGNNNTKFFKNQVTEMIKNKEENNKIDWGDLETTANAILQKLIPYVRKMVQDPSEEIKKILEEEKLKKGEEVVKKWIDKNKGEEDVKKWIDIRSGFFMKKGFKEISTQIYNSRENTYMLKDIDTDQEEKKTLLKGSEIIGFLKKIKIEEGKKRFENLSDGEVSQKQKNKFEEFEELEEEEEKKKEEEAKKSLEENRYNGKNLNISDIPFNNISKNENIINNKEKMSFKEQVNEQIEKNIKDINWGDIPGAAQEIHNNLTKDAQRELNAFGKIENILKEKKSEGEKEAVRNWLDKNKEEIKNKDLDTIITMFISNKEANIYDISYKEIIVILDEKCRDDLSIGQENQLREYKVKILEEEEKKKEREKKKLEEEKKKYDDEAELAKQTLGNEPDDNNPDTCRIKFRLPDGEKILERKFLKTDRISFLYNFVKSNGREILIEEEGFNFSLNQPYPPKKYDQMNNTLEQEGLFPNAMLQIRLE